TYGRNMSFNLLDIWAHMGALSRVIAGTLFLMAIASVGVVVERFLAFAKAAKASRAFAHAAGPVLADGRLDRIRELAAAHRASPLARLFDAVTTRYLDAAVDGRGGVAPVELARNEALRRQEAIGADLRRGMNVLASVGSVAP